MDQKRLNRRDFLRLSALTAAGAALAGCGPAPTPQVIKETVEVPVEKTVVVEATKEPTPVPQPIEPTELEGTVVWMQDYDLDALTFVPEFNETYPKVTIEQVGWDETRFYAMIAAGQPPDLYGINGMKTAFLAGRKLVLDLAPFVDISTKVTWDDLSDAHLSLRWDGSKLGSGPLYGIVKDSSPDNQWWVNTGDIEAAGFTVPGPTDYLKYPDVAAMAEAMTQREGDRTLRFGFAHGGAEEVEPCSQLACVEAGTTLYDEFYSKVILVDNEPVVTYLKWYLDMAVKGVVPSAKNPAGWIAEDWTQRKVSMMGNGYWVSGLLKMWAVDSPEVETLMNDDALMLAGLTWTGQKLNPEFGSTSTAIFPKSGVPDAAWAFLEFYTAGTPGITRAKAGWGAPPLKSLFPLMPNETEFDKRVQASLQEVSKHGSGIPIQQNPFYDPNLFGSSAWQGNFDRAVNGEITFEEMVQNMENEVNQLIYEGVQAVSG